jgi:hypothetical protein
VLIPCLLFWSPSTSSCFTIPIFPTSNPITTP